MTQGSARVQSLHVYPIKSCRGIEVTAWPLDALGLRHDRRFMIVRPDGAAVTQRELPVLARVATRLEAPFSPGGFVELSTESQRAIRVPLQARDQPIEVEVWGDRVLARTIDAAIDRWLTSLAGEALRLVAFPDEADRPVDPAWAPGFSTAFADGFPLLVLGQASLDDLNARLARPLPMDRFRPNLVTVGAPAFAEDAWRDLRVGEAAIRVVKPCGRCAVVAIDQTTGARSVEPLRTLARFRRQGNELMFGQNAVVTTTGTIQVGDAITPIG